LASKPLGIGLVDTAGTDSGGTSWTIAVDRNLGDPPAISINPIRCGEVVVVKIDKVGFALF